MITTAPASVAPSDRIPLFQKITFSAGCGTDYMATGLTTGVLWMPYFNIGLGMSPALLGLILMILQAWSAIIDPVIGNFSDNLRTPWGRRRPLMACGALATALIYPFLWRVPQAGPHTMAAYLVVIGIFYFTCFSCWSMPFYGLQLELTPDYDERTRLTAWLTVFGKLTYLFGAWTLAIVSSSLFAAPGTNQPDIVAGVKTCSWFMAGIILIVGLLPALCVKERYYQADASHQSRDPFWKSLGESCRCSPLWALIGISFFLVLGSTSVASMGQYINIYYINGGNIRAASMITGWCSTASLVTGILSIPLWTWLSEKFDKKRLVIGLLLGGMVGHSFNLFCLNPRYPYLQLIPAMFQSGVIAAVWLFLPSMKADVADYDELHTHRRREGSLNAFYSWFIKAALTCAMGLGGLTLQLSGFDVSHAAQESAVLLRMKLIYLALPISIWAGALIFIWFYPLGRQCMAEIRGQLEARRGKL